MTESILTANADADDDVTRQANSIKFRESAAAVTGTLVPKRPNNGTDIPEPKYLVCWASEFRNKTDLKKSRIKVTLQPWVDDHTHEEVIVVQYRARFHLTNSNPEHLLSGA